MSNTSSTAGVVDPTLPHDSYGPQLNVTVWFLGAVAAAWLILRIYCKFLRRRTLWWDDHILIASLVTLLLGNIAVSVSIYYGFGKQSYDVSPENIPPLIVAGGLAGSLMIIGAAWSKTSFALTLVRISTGWQKKFLWFTVVFLNAAFGGSVLLTWIRCWPIEKSWHPDVEGTCLPNTLSLWYNTFISAYSGVMDITLALLPWNILWGLGMDKKEKFSALAAMSMGIFAGITSLVKIYAIQGSAANVVDGIQLVVLAAAEISITIMAASIPILRALVRDKVPRTGPFLALDETDHYTRTRTPPIEPYTGSLPGGSMQMGAGLDSIELQPRTKKKWNAGKQKIQHLSQIEESDESLADRRSRLHTN